MTDEYMINEYIKQKTMQKTNPSLWRQPHNFPLLP